MRLNRVIIAALVAVLLGVGVWLFIAYEMDELALQDKQTMIDDLERGQVLYTKREDYRVTRLGLGPAGHPQTVIDESWMEAGPDGNFDAAIGVIRSLDGEFIQYSELEDNVLTYSDLVNDVYWEENSGSDRDFVGYVESLWNVPQFVVDRGYIFTGRGELNGRDTRIYEQPRTSNSDEGLETVGRIEFVEEWPILMRQGIYEVDADGKETLLQSNTLVEYRVLPQGATVPTIEVDLPTRSMLEAIEQEWLEEGEGEQEEAR